MTSYILEVHENESGDCYIFLPDEIVDDLGWQEGDLLDWNVKGNGIVLSKVNDVSGYLTLED